MADEYLFSRYFGAAELLPYRFRTEAKAVPDSVKLAAEEFRLRIGRMPTVLTPGGELPLSYDPEKAVASEDLNAVMDMAACASAHTQRESIKSGFVTGAGGFRIGFCGSCAVREGEMIGYHALSSANIRISKEVPCVSEAMLAKLAPRGSLLPTLIVSPPGCGKTTLLRDLIRTLSEGCEAMSIRRHRIGLADERGEIAAMRGGVPQLEVGPITDVMDGCPKARAVIMMLRAMNPEVIAFDEITAPEDVCAIESAANCGVTLLATAHAENLRDLSQRQMYRRLLESGIFKRAVIISVREGKRYYETAQTGDPE